MKLYNIIILVALAVLNFSCQKDPLIAVEDSESTLSTVPIEPPTVPSCKTTVMNNGKVFIDNNRKWLWGGDDDTWHFDITGWELNECKLHFGLGREWFKALIDPQYISVSLASAYHQDGDRFMIVYTDQEPLVYAISLLQQHEVINETVDGAPIMVAYCSLANLGAVYTRIYCGQEFTFALSGYTYHDLNVWNNVDGFVMWDRETESLWWPLIDKAVSGPMGEADVYMEKHDETKWEETTWEVIVADYPDAKVLAIGQTMTAPIDWPQYENSNLNCK